MATKLSLFIWTSPLLHGRKHANNSLMGDSLVRRPYELILWWHLPMSNANRLLIDDPQIKSKHSCNCNSSVKNGITQQGSTNFCWTYCLFKLFQNNKWDQWLRSSSFNAQNRKWQVVQMIRAVILIISIMFVKKTNNQLKITYFRCVKVGLWEAR